MNTIKPAYTILQGHFWPTFVSRVKVNILPSRSPDRPELDTFFPWIGYKQLLETRYSDH